MLKEWEDIHADAKGDIGVLSTEINHAVGEDAVLAPALSLVDNDLVTVHYGGMVTYVHVLFDRHEIIFANGAASESYHPGAYGLQSIADPARDELFRLFPALRVNPADYGPTSRPCIRARDARALVMH